MDGGEEHVSDRQPGTLPAGKLDHAFLRELLGDLTGGADVVLGPGVGRDVAIVDAGGVWLALKSDPITFATDEIGWYAVHVNANDLASAGAEPRWFLATLLLPEGAADEDLVRRIMADLREAAHSMGIALVGGHTEVTVGLDRPIVSGTMIGTVTPESLVRPDGIRPGDVVLLTKGLAVETTAILAREMPDRLRAAGLTDAQMAKAAAYLRTPGISVVRDARVARQAGDVHAMHDATEGGVATALDELSEASGIGLDVDRAALVSAISPLSAKVCAAVSVDPLGTISSGAMLVAVAAKTASAVIDALAAEGIPAFSVAQATDRESGCRYSDGTPWPRFRRDEIARVFEEAP